MIGRRWYSTAKWAALHGSKPATLRTQLKRNARQLDDGSVEARVGPARGRMLGELWRVCDATAPAEATPGEPSLANIALSLDLTEPAVIRRFQRNAKRTA